MGVIVGRVCKLSEVDKEDDNILSPLCRHSYLPAPVTNLAHSSSSLPSMGEPDVVYILTLGVRAFFRRKGIGARLMRELLDTVNTAAYYNCKCIYLHVDVENTGAVQFYESNGFSLHTRLHEYYTFRDGSLRDAFTYVLYVNGGSPPSTFSSALTTCMSELIKGIKKCIGRFGS